jgi:chromosome segregation ATPase
VKEHLLIFWQRKLEDAYRENYDLKADYARLKAEVERLTQLNSTLALRYDATNSMLDGCAKEIEEMEAQVERLTKAGDEMHRAIKVSDPILDWKIELWLAAKEGKQP